MKDFNTAKEVLNYANSEYNRTNVLQIVTFFNNRFFCSTIKTLHESTRFSSEPINVIFLVGYGKEFVPLQVTNNL